MHQEQKVWRKKCKPFGKAAQLSDGNSWCSQGSVKECMLVKEMSPRPLPLTGHLHSSLSQPLRINGVKVYSENVDKRQIIMDLQIRWRHCDEPSWHLLILQAVPLFSIPVFSFTVTLETLKSMWISKGTTAERGSKVYRYIVVSSHQTYSFLLSFVHNTYTATHVMYGIFHWTCLRDPMDYVSQGQRVNLLDTEKLFPILWRNHVFHGRNPVDWTEPIFTERVCVFIGRRVTKYWIALVLFCSTGSEIYTHAHTMTVPCMIYVFVAVCHIKCVAEQSLHVTCTMLCLFRMHFDRMERGSRK